MVWVRQSLCNCGWLSGRIYNSRARKLSCPYWPLNRSPDDWVGLETAKSGVRYCEHPGSRCGEHNCVGIPISRTWEVKHVEWYEVRLRKGYKVGAGTSRGDIGLAVTHQVPKSGTAVLLGLLAAFQLCKAGLDLPASGNGQLSRLQSGSLA